MASLKLKGINTPIEVEVPQAVKIEKLWEEHKQGKRTDEPLTVGTITCSLSDIKVIDTRGVGKGKDFSDYYDAQGKAFREYKKQKLEQTPTERAKTSYKLAQLVWWAHTEQWDPPKDVEAKIKTALLSYHEENPDQLYANPILYKDLIPPATEKKGAAPFRAGTMSLVESILSAAK